MVSSESLDEIHEFAEDLGVGKHFFNKGNHYDIAEELFQSALNSGAVLVTSKQIVRIINK